MDRSNRARARAGGGWSRRRGRRAVGVGVVLGVVVLTGCQPGPREDFVILSHSTFRCGSGQSWVGEQADKTDAGLLPAWAGTAARRDVYCGNADGLAPTWNRLEARAEVHRNGAICQAGSPVATYSAGDVLASVEGWCGAGSYRAVGRHAARAGSTTYSGTSGAGAVSVS